MSSLAAARADNFYFKNDFDPTKPNRPKKPDHLKKDYSTIRFEVMFHIKCTQCQKMLAKGERFDARKKQIGYFHTTKIWEFQFHCPACPQIITCKTDPENCDYVFTDGARRIVKVLQQLNVNNESESDATFFTFRKKEIDDPFKLLENQQQDKIQANLEKPRLQQIQVKNQLFSKLKTEIWMILTQIDQ